MFNVTVTVTAIVALVAALGAGFAAPSILGRHLTTFELVAVALAVGLLGWGFTATRRRRLRRQILEMRDSALW